MIDPVRARQLLGASAPPVLRLDRAILRLRYQQATFRRRHAALAEALRHREQNADRNLQRLQGEAAESAAAVKALRDERQTILFDIQQSETALTGPLGQLAATIRALLVRDAKGVSATRTAIREQRGRIRTLAERIAKADAEHRRRLEAVNAIVDGIDSHRFAMQFLDAETAQLQRRIDTLNGDIDDTVRRAVCHAPLAALATRLAASPPDAARERLFGQLLTLRDACRRHGSLAALVTPDAEPPPQREALTTALTAAVANGITRDRADGQGSVELRGHGTKHVRRRRGKNTYWAETRVSLEGRARAAFAVRSSRWQRAATVDVLRDLAWSSAADAARREREHHVARELPELERTIRTAAAFLRQWLEGRSEQS